jgi:hypothetical protein
MGEWLLSRRDGAIVAWHESAWNNATPKSRPVGYGMIRAFVQVCRNAGAFSVGISQVQKTVR